MVHYCEGVYSLSFPYWMFHGPSQACGKAIKREFAGQARLTGPPGRKAWEREFVKIGKNSDFPRRLRQGCQFTTRLLFRDSTGQPVTCSLTFVLPLVVFLLFRGSIDLFASPEVPFVQAFALPLRFSTCTPTSSTPVGVPSP